MEVKAWGEGGAYYMGGSGKGECRGMDSLTNLIYDGATKRDLAHEILNLMMLDNVWQLPRGICNLIFMDSGQRLSFYLLFNSLLLLVSSSIYIYIHFFYNNF